MFCRAFSTCTEFQMLKNHMSSLVFFCKIFDIINVVDFSPFNFCIIFGDVVTDICKRIIYRYIQTKKP